MEWIIALSVCVAVCGLTLAVAINLLRRQRRQLEKLLTEFGTQQLTTNKRITEILVEQNDKIHRTATGLEILKDITVHGLRRDVDNHTTQIREIIQDFLDGGDDQLDSPAKTTRTLN